MKITARGIIRFAGVAILSVVIALMTAWSVLAIYYSSLPGEALRLVLSGIFAVAVIAAFLFLPRRGRTLACFLAAFCVVAAWWIMIPASNSRNWQRDVARAPYAVIDGNLVTIHDIRNFSYRTETDFDPVYYDKTFDLTKLDSVDLISVYWMGDAIAHVMMSFGFQGRDFVCFSIETRREQGEDYSTIKGFFKQYELIYVAGDERDLIRLRTDYRNPREDVYLYRLYVSPEKKRGLFMEYVRRINKMKERPEWYNTLTTNCTTNIVSHIKTSGGRARYNWKVLLSGYAPQYAYELGALDTRIPFGKLRQQSRINVRAHAIGDDPEFSRKIREGLVTP